MKFRERYNICLLFIFMILYSGLLLIITPSKSSELSETLPLFFLHNPVIDINQPVFDETAFTEIETSEEKIRKFLTISQHTCLWDDTIAALGSELFFTVLSSSYYSLQKVTDGFHGYVIPLRI